MLREDQRSRNDDVANIQMRWHALREEKLKASSILHNLRKSDEDINQLCEDRVQVELNQKVQLVLNLSYL